jgi:hypothetical protein
MKIENKGYKITELHNELSNLRDALEKSEYTKDFLQKQVEIYHITNGSTHLLSEMACKLNFTKDERELYKEKLAKIQDLIETLPKNKLNLTAPSSSRLYNYIL